MMLNGAETITSSQTSLFFLWVASAVVIFLVIWLQVRRIPKYSFLFVVGLLLYLGMVLLFIQVPYVNAEFSHALAHAFIIAAILAAIHYNRARIALPSI